MSQMVRIVLVDGNTVDFTPASDFQLGVFVASIRSQGYLMLPTFYTESDSIRSIFVYDPDAQALPEPTARVGTLQ